MYKSELKFRVKELNKLIETATDKRQASLWREERKWIREMLDPAVDTRGMGAGSSEYAKKFDRYLRSGDASGVAEYRVSTGLSTSPNSGQTDPANGGYEIPQAFWNNIQIALKAYGGLASYYQQIESPTGAPMPWPTLDPTAVLASVLGQENTQLATASPYQLGQGTMNAWTIATNPILVSLQLVNDSAFDMDSLLARLIGEACGREVAALAASGTGSAQPLGVITALNSRGSVGTSGGAITPTGGFVTLAAATTVKSFATSAPTELAGNILSPATLISMVQAVDPAYYGSCAWFFNAAQAWNLRQTVDNNGRPLINYANGLEMNDNPMDGGVPSSDGPVNVPVARLLGFPVVIDNSIPNLTASTTGGPVFGSMRHAMVLRTVVGQQGSGASILRLQERYADFLAVGYLGFLRTDIRSNDLRAAVTVKPAAT